MPAPIANLTLLNTFDEQRKVINQLVVSVNDTDASSNLINVKSNTSSLFVSANVAKRGVLYIDTNLTSTISNTSVNVIASAASVNIVNQLRISGDANNKNTSGIMANASNAWANTLSIQTGSAANTYAAAQAQSVRNQAGLMANAANSYMLTTVGAIDISAVAVLKSPGACNYMQTGVSIPAASLIIRKQDNAFEGGEFHLEKPTNTLLYGNVIFDIYNNNIRIFEGGGSYKGITANLASSNGGASSVIITDSNIGTQIAKNINEFPLNQDVRNTASPTFPNINVTGNLKKTGAGAGGFYDEYNQTGLLSVDAGYLRTNHPSAPWYNSNKQVGMVVEGDLWFNSGYGSGSGKAYGCRAWGAYTTGGTATNTQAITWWWKDPGNSNPTGSTFTYAGSKIVTCMLNNTTCDAMGITVSGTSVTLDKGLYYNWQAGDLYQLVKPGTYTAIKVSTNVFIMTISPDGQLGPWWNFAWSGTDAVTISKTTPVAGYTLGAGGVSSIVDNGSGIYTVNFSTPMPDANYAIIAKYLQEGMNSAGLNTPYNIKNQYGFNLQVTPTAPSATYWPFYFAIFR